MNLDLNTCKDFWQTKFDSSWKFNLNQRTVSLVNV